MGEIVGIDIPKDNEIDNVINESIYYPTTWHDPSKLGLVSILVAFDFSSTFAGYECHARWTCYWHRAAS